MSKIAPVEDRLARLLDSPFIARVVRHLPPETLHQIIAMLDMTAWIGVLGLLDECPVVPAALIAVLDGRTTSVSPMAFDFISTTAQIGDVRIFIRKLPHVLSR